MSTIEIIAVVSSFFSVAFAIKKITFNWIIGIVGIIFYSILFYKTNLYSNFMLQFVYLFQSVYGLFYWVKHKKQKGSTVTPTFIKWTLVNCILILFYFITSSWLLCILFESSKSYISDSITTSLSILACYLLTKGKIENWIFWIIADIFYICIFYKEKMYLSSILYFLFILLCIRGIIEWTKSMKNE